MLVGPGLKMKSQRPGNKILLRHVVHENCLKYKVCITDQRLRPKDVTEYMLCITLSLLLGPNLSAYITVTF